MMTKDDVPSCPFSPFSNQQKREWEKDRERKMERWKWMNKEREDKECKIDKNVFTLIAAKCISIDINVNLQPSWWFFSSSSFFKSWLSLTFHLFIFLSLSLLLPSDFDFKFESFSNSLYERMKYTTKRIITHTQYLYMYMYSQYL